MSDNNGPRVRTGEQVANELHEGDPRLGAFYDGDGETPDAQVSLALKKGRVRLSIAWPDDSSPYAAWFGHGKGQSHSGKPRVPETLLFHDSKGTVLLAGCRSGGYNVNFFGPGTGHIAARYAVLGPQEILDFTSANSADCELLELRDWLGISSVDLNHVFGGDDPRTEIVVRASDPIEVAVDPQLQFLKRYAIEQPSLEHPDQWLVRDTAICRVSSKSLTDVRELLEPARGVRDLLALSRWWDEVLTLSALSREDDPLRTMDGKEHGPQWRPVVGFTSKKPAPAPNHRWHLYEYAEVGPAGILNWLDIRESFARALDPVVSAVAMRELGPISMLAQIGPGLEALGYLLFREDGKSKAEAKDTTLLARAELIADKVAEAAPFDSATWPARFAKAYNGIKHANRTLPDEIEVLRVNRDSINAMRAWVGRRLGIDASVLAKRFENDWLAEQEWVPA
jgi:hypothetical protein